MPHLNKGYNEVKDKTVFLMVKMVDGISEIKEKGKLHINNSGFTFPMFY